ncbi:uncharacterized protein LOC111267637 isoform X3 [Varroa jacobsoni]|uniref:uncharacterized protein LOC111267637 isoform X3 n=1 Tax=Varroa jacobsoni TaxID=62625 RepID=UPI000BFA1BF7|nr:uncharacterized protein LOC111267637 isoform X3 [Varroa jacobsoni]
MEEPLLKRRYRPLGKPGLGSAIAHAVPVVVGAAVKNPGFFRNFIYANPPFAGPPIRDAVNMAFRRRVLTRVRGSLEIYEYWKDIRLNRNTDPDMNVPNENTFDTSFTSRFIEIKFSPKELYKKCLCHIFGRLNATKLLCFLELFINDEGGKTRSKNFGSKNLKSNRWCEGRKAEDSVL